MDKFNSDYEEYLEKNGIGVVKNGINVTVHI